MMRYKFKLGSTVRSSSFNHRPGGNSGSPHGLAKPSVLLPLALMFLFGVTASGNLFAAQLTHRQQTKEANHAVYSPLANAPASARTDPAGQAPKSHSRRRSLKVHTGAFEPASIVNPALEKSSRKVQTGVFAAATWITNQASVEGGERPALVGLFDLASEG